MIKIPRLANYIKVSVNFFLFEFESKRTRKVWIHPLVVKFTQKTRDILSARHNRDIRIVITSGCRTWWEDFYIAKGRSKYKAHIKGTGVDCYSPDINNLHQLEAVLYDAGFTFVKRYSTHCHADIRGKENEDS